LDRINAPTSSAVSPSGSSGPSVASIEAAPVVPEVSPSASEALSAVLGLCFVGGFGINDSGKSGKGEARNALKVKYD
jgi:hypothetical protein